MGKSCKVQVLGSRKRNSASDAEIAKIKQCQSKKKETFKSKITNLKNKVVTNVKKADSIIKSKIPKVEIKITPKNK
tara:strand:+ start:1502 stop:1729 length:228 start_codon:yes stop_codon:yes gene_type:complete